MKKWITKIAEFYRSHRFSILEGTALGAALLVFGWLSCQPHLLKDPPQLLPREYKNLEQISAGELEGLLYAKDPSVRGLVTFDGLPELVVERKGLDHDQLVLECDHAHMIDLAEKAQVGVINEHSVQADADWRDKLPIWWIPASFVLVAWIGKFLFLQQRNRANEKVGNRYAAISWYVQRVVDNIVERNNLKKAHFYYIVLGALVVTNGWAYLGGFYSDPPTKKLPPYLSSAKLTPHRQITRFLAEKPSAFQYIGFFDEARTAAVSIKQEANYRIVMFPDTVAGKANFDGLAKAARDNHIESGHVQLEIDKSEHLSATGQIVMFSLLGLTALVSMTLLTKRKQWEEKSPGVVLAYASSGGASSPTTRAHSRVPALPSNWWVQNLDDVAGVDQAKEETRDLLDMLFKPNYYSAHGAPRRRGILYHGPSGTGKTSLARGVAGELARHFDIPPFFKHVAGSFFVQETVGRGAINVREVFQECHNAWLQTGKLGPRSILFIDEVEGACPVRKKGLNQEWVQTADAILEELDGYYDREVVVLAATNRLDMVDPALWRDGRLQAVEVGKPDFKGQKDIYRVKLSKVPLILTGTSADEKAVELEQLIQNLAEKSPGFTGASIERAVASALVDAIKRNYGHLPDLTREQLATWKPKPIVTIQSLFREVEKVGRSKAASEGTITEMSARDVTK